jgi:PAS domain S-box-containing protein
MLKIVTKYFSHPVFPDDEEKTRVSKVLFALLLNNMTVLALAVLITIFFAANKTGGGTIIGVILALTLVSSVLAQRGLVQCACIFYVTGMWMVFTPWMLLTGRINTTAVALHIALAVIAGILLGRRAALITAILSSIAGLGMAIFEYRGSPLAQYFPSPPLSGWAVWMLAYSWTITPLYITIRGSDQALAISRKNEKRYSSLFDESLIMYLVVRDEGGVPVIRECNAAFVNILGYSREQVVGHPVKRFYSPVSWPVSLELKSCQYMLRDEQKALAERDLVSRDGRIVHTLLGSAPEVDHSGKTVGVLAMYLDVTERTRAEEELTRLHHQNELIMLSAAEGIMGLDARGCHTFVNPAAARMLGYQPEELIGRHGHGTWHHARPDRSPYPEEECLICAAYRDGSGHSVSTEVFWRKNGTYFPVQYTSTPIVEQERLSGAVVTFADITERRRNEVINAARLYLIEYAVSHSLDELLEETLNEAERLCRSVIGFYHFVEDDQVNLTLQNWSTRTKAEFCRADGKGMHYPINQAGVWVDCVHERKPVIHNDYQSLPHRKGMPEGHASVIRELVVPVIRDEKVVAILGVGNKPDDYIEADIEAVSLLADLAWEIVVRKQVEAELICQLSELQRWHDITLNREERILELKREVNTLLKEAGGSIKYDE